MIALYIIQMLFSFIVPFLPIIIPVAVVVVVVWYFWARMKRFFKGMMARVTCLKNPFKYKKCINKATAEPGLPKKSKKQRKREEAAAKAAAKAARPPAPPKK